MKIIPGGTGVLPQTNACSIASIILWLLNDIEPPEIHMENARAVKDIIYPKPPGLAQELRSKTEKNAAYEKWNDVLAAQNYLKRLIDDGRIRIFTVDNVAGARVFYDEYTVSGIIFSESKCKISAFIDDYEMLKNVCVDFLEFKKVFESDRIDMESGLLKSREDLIGEYIEYKAFESYLLDPFNVNIDLSKTRFIALLSGGYIKAYGNRGINSNLDECVHWSHATYTSHDSHYRLIPKDVWNENGMDWEDGSIRNAEGEYINVLFNKGQLQNLLSIPGHQDSTSAISIIVESSEDEASTINPVKETECEKGILVKIDGREIKNLSPYLEFLISVADQLEDIQSQEEYRQKDGLVYWLEQNCPQELHPSKNKREYMATFLRHPEHTRGASKKSTGATR